MLWEERPIQRIDTIDPRPIGLGAAVLVIGALVYLTDRNPASVMILQGLADVHRLPGIWGPLSGVLPDFAHACSFSLLTAGVMGRKPGMAIPVCLFWFFTETLFELGQKFPDRAMALIPDSLFNVPPVRWASVYFTQGTFDPLDILAFAAGSASAFALLSVMNKRSNRSWAQSSRP